MPMGKGTYGSQKGRPPEKDKMIASALGRPELKAYEAVKELIVAVWISSFENNLAYQRNEKPVHIIANLLELKL